MPLLLGFFVFPQWEVEEIKFQTFQAYIFHPVVTGSIKLVAKNPQHPSNNYNRQHKVYYSQR